LAPYRFRLRPEVRRAIARGNLSQNEVARRCGLTSGFLSQLLRGQRNPGPRTRARLLKALPGMSFDELFEEVDHP
jgi:transcriptional regulator with XRE-family HTH domain